jgi:uncharacterized membrane protein YgcG
MRGKRRLLVSLAVGVGLVAGLVVASQSQVGAASGPVFTVMNTSETPPDGVWFRNSPHTADTDRVTGHGVYMGDRVQLQCYAWGDAVGAYSNRLWYYVNNVTRPIVPSNGQPNVGYLNAHYINDGAPANVVDTGVGQCGAAPSPPAVPSVTLAQGPVAPAGYRYAITLSGFGANSSVSISCRDSVSPGGFYTFSLTTNGSGQAFTQGYCYSDDGPDHWVVANGIKSNYVSWGSAPSGGGNAGGGSTGGGSAGGGSNSPGGGAPTGGSGSSASQTPRSVSVFYSGTETPTGAANIKPADQNLALSQFSAGNCTDGKAVKAVNFRDGQVGTLAGWSKGRLGPIYFLSAAGKDRVDKVHRIVMFDPGSTSDFAKPAGLRALLRPTCDWRYDINSLLATWLNSNPANHLIVLTAEASEEKGQDGKPTYAGLWKYYFAGIWNKPYASRAQVCDYDNMNHTVVLEKFYTMVNSNGTSCPSGPNRTIWNP